MAGKMAGFSSLKEQSHFDWISKTKATEDYGFLGIRVWLRLCVNGTDSRTRFSTLPESSFQQVTI
jgi:hypothetical protein